MYRYAIVRRHGITAEQVAAYLPRNYRVIWAGKLRISPHESHCPFEKQ